ncbi:MAG: SDR family oxidoreductase [Gluconacetobacter diazotrophicus]|nr:SDR family oxidoreductase [Gluconacetobacter diazotrophicus]
MTRYLITGANRGLGLEFTRQLLARGDSVIACCREPDAAKALQELTDSADDRLTVRELDVTDADAIAELPNDLPAFDVLINNAGIAAPEERYGAFDAGMMTRVLFVNSIAPMLVTQALTPLLERGGKEPKVVCITSELGSITQAQGLSFGLSYGMSKAALNMGVKKLGSELKRRGIAVIAMHPGWVQTDMGGKNATLQPEESIRGMLGIIDKLTTADNGRYLTYAGKELPW